MDVQSRHAGIKACSSGKEKRGEKFRLPQSAVQLFAATLI
jgi:hypothetical protein